MTMPPLTGLENPPRACAINMPPLTGLTTLSGVACACNRPAAAPAVAVGGYKSAGSWIRRLTARAFNPPFASLPLSPLRWSAGQLSLQTCRGQGHTAERWRITNRLRVYHCKRR